MNSVPNAYNLPIPVSQSVVLTLIRSVMHPKDEIIFCIQYRKLLKIAFVIKLYQNGNILETYLKLLYKISLN